MVWYISLLYALTLLLWIIIMTSFNPITILLAFVTIILEIVVLLIGLNLEIFAYMLLAVYVGAIIVLFLFFTMLASMQVQYKQVSSVEKLLIAVISVLMFCQLYCWATTPLEHPEVPSSYNSIFLWIDAPTRKAAITHLAFSLYTDYCIVLIILTLLLLVALIAPILLTMPSPQHALTKLKKQTTAYQINTSVERSLNNIHIY